MTNSWRNPNAPVNSKNLEHNEFLNRIRKSLYYSKLSGTNCLSLPVTELAAEFFTEVKSDHTLKKLDIEEASKISRNTCVSPCSFVLALLYIERLKICNPEYLQQVAPSELFLVSLMVASKFLHDDGEDNEVFNAEWANSGQLTISHMNKLEKEFLDAIEWTVFVQHQDFWERLRRLEQEVAYREVQKRGWCSYTELSCLMDSAQLITIAHTLISVSTICLATYAAGLVTLLGSALVASCLPGTSLSPKQLPNLRINITDSSKVLLPDTWTNPQFQEVNSELSTSEWLIRNETVSNYSVVNAENDINSWKWWLNSAMIWLPEYSAFENDIEVTDSPTLFFSKVKFSFDSPQPKKIEQNNDFVSDDHRSDVNWKEVLGSDLKMLIQDHRYFTSYVTKVSVNHRR